MRYPSGVEDAHETPEQRTKIMGSRRYCLHPLGYSAPVGLGGGGPGFAGAREMGYKSSWPYFGQVCIASPQIELSTYPLSLCIPTSIPSLADSQSKSFISRSRCNDTGNRGSIKLNNGSWEPRGLASRIVRKRSVERVTGAMYAKSKYVTRVIQTQVRLHTDYESSVTV